MLEHFGPYPPATRPSIKNDRSSRTNIAVHVSRPASSSCRDNIIATAAANSRLSPFSPAEINRKAVRDGNDPPDQIVPRSQWRALVVLPTRLSFMPANWASEVGRDCLRAYHRGVSISRPTLYEIRPACLISFNARDGRLIRPANRWHFRQDFSRRNKCKCVAFSFFFR